jgi:DNA-binding response OmpR family regulator
MNKINLLLVEDDPNLGLLLKEYLLAKNFDVTLATNGEDGYKIFKDGRFQFVILESSLFLV